MAFMKKGRAVPQKVSPSYELKGPEASKLASFFNQLKRENGLNDVAESLQRAFKDKRLTQAELPGVVVDVIEALMAIAEEADRDVARVQGDVAALGRRVANHSMQDHVAGLGYGSGLSEGVLKLGDARILLPTALAALAGASTFVPVPAAVGSYITGGYNLARFIRYIPPGQVVLSNMPSDAIFRFGVMFTPSTMRARQMGCVIYNTSLMPIEDQMAADVTLPPGYKFRGAINFGSLSYPTTDPTFQAASGDTMVWYDFPLDSTADTVSVITDWNTLKDRTLTADQRLLVVYDREMALALSTSRFTGPVIAGALTAFNKVAGMLALPLSPAINRFLNVGSSLISAKLVDTGVGGTQNTKLEL